MSAPSAAAPVYRCSICGEPSQHICNWCTKDTCDNHLCAHCRRCSDCCECELSLDAEPAAATSNP